MARNASVSIENNFTGGLVTDSTGLNFPENACSDVANIVFERSGAFRRRLGLDYETSFTKRTITTAGNAISSYVWKAAAGDGNNQLVVVQVGDELDFYLAGDTTLSGEYLSSIDLTTFSPVGAPSPATTECQFAAGLGYLFVTHPNLESFYVEYDPSDDSLTATEITLEIRDFEGVDDGLAIRERPATLSEAHEYNLLNQGWDTSDKDSATGADPDEPALDMWERQRSDEPSNADIWHLFNVSDGLNFAANAGNVDSTTSPAPRGHFILPYYDQDRNAVTPHQDSSRTITGVTTTTSGDARASTIAFFAGRVWYAGVAAQGYSNRILFSQIIERDSQIGDCYQVNDPTDEHTFDLLPSDGGVISIPDSGTIIRLTAMEDSMIVHATNGVWAIRGSEGTGFRANDYSVAKISGIACVSASSFVEINGAPAWWNLDGIYTVAPNETGSLVVQSITENKISDFYDDIPFLSRQYARGAYDPVSREVHWVYRSTSPSTVAQQYAYDRVLTLNVQTGSFSVWTVTITNVVIHGVLALTDTPTGNSGQFFYYVSETADGESTFALARDTDYVDWASATSSNFSSYVTTGYKLRGDAQRKFQPTYVYIFADNEETGATSLDIQGRWGFATSGSTGRWSGTQRRVFDGGNYLYEYRRVKIRGHGIVLQLHISSVDGEPMSLIGWSIFETGNAQV